MSITKITGVMSSLPDENTYYAVRMDNRKPNLACDIVLTFTHLETGKDGISFSENDAKITTIAEIKETVPAIADIGILKSGFDKVYKNCLYYFVFIGNDRKKFFCIVDENFKYLFPLSKLNMFNLAKTIKLH